MRQKRQQLKEFWQNFIVSSVTYTRLNSVYHWLVDTRTYCRQPNKPVFQHLNIELSSPLFAVQSRKKISVHVLIIHSTVKPVLKAISNKGQSILRNMQWFIGENHFPNKDNLRIKASFWLSFGWHLFTCLSVLCSGCSTTRHQSINSHL